ncbi:MAG: hypothetical protein EAZ67_10665 [Cytophagales bacterium]|nr:MAG: hypothetical protein EAZ67_10665 [Cytophagales bacterium]
MRKGQLFEEHENKNCPSVKFKHCLREDCFKKTDLSIFHKSTPTRNYRAGLPSFDWNLYDHQKNLGSNANQAERKAN